MIPLKSSEEIEKIATGGKILSGVLKKLAEEAKTGIVLEYLDDLAFKLIKEAGAKPAFFGYRPSGAKHSYRASICASINEVVVHGFPTDYKLKDGDILKLDLGVKYQNFYSDAAITLGIGDISSKSLLLIKATKEALDETIKIIKPGGHLGDIGFVISNVAKKYRFKVIKGLTGHGIGIKLHEEPTIYNFGEENKGIKLKAGMVLAIEPMFSSGSDQIIQRADESWATVDGSLTAHFEHTVAIIKKGVRILTQQ